MKVLSKKSPQIKVLSMPMEEVQQDCEEWAAEIAACYIPDLIVFIAKSGYLFAEPLSKYFGCRMVDITAKRPASGGKDKIKGIIKLMPEKIIMRILSSPFMYRFHEKNQERIIEISDKFLSEKEREHKNILIVDDSVDTGFTLQRVYKEVKRSFPSATVKAAGYSVIEYSKSRIFVDFYRYENAIILTATSRKSDEYEKFVRAYAKWASDNRN